LRTRRGRISTRRRRNRTTSSRGTTAGQGTRDKTKDDEKREEEEVASRKTTGQVRSGSSSARDVRNSHAFLWNSQKVMGFLVFFKWPKFQEVLNKNDKNPTNFSGVHPLHLSYCFLLSFFKTKKRCTEELTNSKFHEKGKVLNKNLTHQNSASIFFFCGI